MFIERLWRTVKYEDVYLRAYSDGKRWATPYPQPQHMAPRTFLYLLRALSVNMPLVLFVAISSSEFQRGAVFLGLLQEARSTG